MLRKVFLYGDLAEKFGSEFELDVNSFHECARALAAIFPDFRKTISPNEYALFCDDANIGHMEIGININSGAFHIFPKVFGRSTKSKILNVGIAEFVIGAVLFAASFYAGPVAGPILFNVGIGFMVGGAVTMLMSGLIPDIETEAARKSFIFSNISNSTKQGVAVPICYGRHLVGSVVVSGSLDVDDLSDDYSITHTIS